MGNVLILCFGFDFGDSTNANAHCLNSLLQNRYERGEIVIFTNGNKDEVSVRENITLYKFNVSSKSNHKSRIRLFKQLCISALKNNISANHFTTLLTVSFPFQIGELGVLIKKKHPHLKLLSYFLDPYAFNKALRLPNVLYKYRAYKEMKVIKSSDIMIIAKDLMLYYNRWEAKVNLNKFYSLPIPVLEIKKEIDCNVSNKIRMVFAGSLDLSFRDPNPFLLFLLDIYKRKNIEFEIDFYTNNIEIVSEEIIRSFQGALRMNNFVNKSELELILLKSDLLINIGNKGLKGAMPSKVIEYIGYKKSILNCYFEDDDVSNDFLKSYPKTFFLKSDDLGDDIKLKFERFLQDQKYITVTDDDIETYYGEFLTDRISERLYSLI